MQQAPNKSNATRGFASMDPAKQKLIASAGGKAAAKGNTANRGFASMNKEKQRLIASKGGQASHGRNRKSGITTPDSQFTNTTSQPM